MGRFTVHGLRVDATLRGDDEIGLVQASTQIDRVDHDINAGSQLGLQKAQQRAAGSTRGTRAWGLHYRLSGAPFQQLK